MPADNDTSHERKLVTILAADVAGYSRLMADDEVATMQTLTDYRAVFTERVTAHKGRVVDTAGDSVLAIFDSVVEAVQAAVDIQRDLATANETLPGHRKMHFRIGVNLGDIIVRDDGTIYGDGVNVAARLEALAEPGGVMVAEDVHRYVEGKLDVGLEDAGEHEVKNIAKPVRAYRVLAEGEASPAKPIKARTRIAIAVATIAVIAIFAGVAAWQYLSEPVGRDDGESAVAETADALPSLPSGPAIAVLAFDNLSGDPEQDYFADGLAEDILTRLATFRDIRVIGRNSSFQYKGKAVDVRKIGQELGADFVLEGSVRRDENSIRVSVQLLETGDGGHAWAKTYDRDLSASSIFAIQDEITEQVASALGGTWGAIAVSEVRSAQGAPTDNLESYECLLVAKHYALQATPELHLTARDCLQEVVAREPKYVDALVWLGQMYMEETWSGYNPRDTGPLPLEAAFDALIEAIRLDPNHQKGLSVLAWAYFSDGNDEQFYDMARRSVATNPDNTETLTEMAMWIGYSGRWDESKVLATRLRSLGAEVPSWHNYTEFNYHYRDKDYAAAAASARATLEIEHWAGPWYLALAYAGMGEDDKAIDALTMARDLEPDLSTETVRGMVEALFLDQTHIALLTNGHAELLEIEQGRAPSRPVIAVLPFDNMSGDPEQEYFADGITEDIITRLAQFPDILVLGRNTTFQFKGQAVDIPTIAEKLSADYVVEGSIRRGGDTVRVTAQLLDSEDGTHLWAETYDRALDPANLFAVQDEITTAIASRIGDPYGEIGQEEFRRLDRQAPRHVSSYDCVLRYFDYNFNLVLDSFFEARNCLKKAVEDEPDYAEALALLAAMYIEEIAFGYDPTSDATLDEALRLLEKATALDPRSGLVRAQLARGLYMTNDLNRAVREIDEAMRLAPNNLEVTSLATWISAYIGEYERSDALMDVVRKMNPNFPPWMNWMPAYAHMARGENTEAIALAEMTQMGWQDWTHAFIAAAHCLNGDIAEGRASLDAALEIDPDLADTYWSETYFWMKGSGPRPIIDAVGAGLEACGWDVPPDPGPEAFAPVQ
jgi:adenylate cyclase